MPAAPTAPETTEQGKRRREKDNAPSKTSPGSGPRVLDGSHFHFRQRKQAVLATRTADAKPTHVTWADWEMQKHYGIDEDHPPHPGETHDEHVTVLFGCRQPRWRHTLVYLSEEGLQTSVSQRDQRSRRAMPRR